jgi:NAD-dependent dihydropyrimidine dehydrogenase PreA subunit
MKIRVDPEACRDALECRLCLERCPGKVFGVYPRRRRAPGVAAGNWVAAAMLPSQCTGCMECVDLCPWHAIRVR